MKFELFVARRYLTRGRKSSFISVISLASIIGIAIGVAALIIAMSLINGFQTDIRDSILSSSAHIMVVGVDGIAEHREIRKTLNSRFEGIKNVMPVVFGTVLIRGSGRDVTGAIFRGMDLKNIENRPWLKNLFSGMLPSKKNEILLGKDLAISLGLYTGSSCMIITPSTTLTPAGVMPKIRRFRISGIFKSGLYEFDNGTVIATLQGSQQLFKLGDRVSYLQVHLRDMFEAESMARKLREMLPAHLQVNTWMELNADLYSVLKMEKVVLFFTLTLIIVVAALNIIAGLILLVIQKTRDIGILLSYGAKPKLIKRIFFFQGGIIGIIGTFTGVAIGALFCYLANKFNLIGKLLGELPTPVYQIGNLTLRLDGWDIVFIVAASLCICFTATLIPSKKAASVNVVDAVKYE